MSMMKLTFQGDERGVLVKRTISRLMVYDSKATDPGILGTILQPIGLLGTDPTESDAITDPDGDFIEMTRITTENDDVPPGILLGSVSYDDFQRRSYDHRLGTPQLGG